MGVFLGDFVSFLEGWGGEGVGSREGWGGEEGWWWFLIEVFGVVVGEFV